MGNKKMPLFYFMPLFALVPGFLMGILLLLIASVILFGLEFGVFSIYCWLIVLFVVYLLVFPILCVKYRRFYIGKRELKKNRVIEKTVILYHSQPLYKSKFNLMSFVLRFFYYKKNATYQKYYYCPVDNNDSNKNDYFIFVLSQENQSIWKRLFSVESADWDSDGKSEILNPKDNISVKIRYGEKSHILFEILPAEKFTYNENQLSAMNQLNMMVADNKRKSHAQKKLQCESLMAVNCFPLCVFLIVVAVTFFVYATILSIICFYCCFSDSNNYLYLKERYLWIAVSLPFVGYLGVWAETEKSISIISLYKGHKHQYCEKNVVFRYSWPILIFDGYSSILKYFFPGKHPIFQGVFYDVFGENEYSNQTGKKNKVYLTITDEKYQLLKELYLKSSKGQTTIYPKSYAVLKTTYLFREGVPLCIVYEKNSKVLHEIKPVESYPYTKEQLSAIEKFNTLYP